MQLTTFILGIFNYFLGMHVYNCLSSIPFEYNDSQDKLFEQNAASDLGLHCFPLTRQFYTHTRK